MARVDSPMNMFPFIIIVLTGVRYAHVLIWNNYVGGMCHFPVPGHNILIIFNSPVI